MPMLGEDFWKRMHDERIEQYNREEQAAAVAKRLLGKLTIPWCERCKCHHFESAGHDPNGD